MSPLVVLLVCRWLMGGEAGWLPVVLERAVDRCLLASAGRVAGGVGLGGQAEAARVGRGVLGGMLAVSSAAGGRAAG
jgi:hypothetical protein